MMRGHYIVADGWAGAADPDPHPTPHPTPFPTQPHTQKASKRSFFHFSTRVHGPTDGPTDGRTDGQTDKASYRVASPRLKMHVFPLFNSCSRTDGRADRPLD